MKLSVNLLPMLIDGLFILANLVRLMNITIYSLQLWSTIRTGTSLSSSRALVDSSIRANWGRDSSSRANAKRCCSPSESTLAHSTAESNPLGRSIKWPNRTHSSTCVRSLSFGGRLWAADLVPDKKGKFPGTKQKTWDKN